MNLSLSGAHSRLLAGLRATAERGGLPHLLALQVDGATRSACIQEVRRSLARGRSLGSGWWSSRSLPLLYIAAQQAYGYPGSGHAYWSGLEALLEHPLSEDDRTALAGHFRRLALLVTGSVRPSDSPWERAYSRIAWPIAHAVLPRMVQLPFALALQRMVALRGSPRATAPPAEVGKSLGTELGSTSNTLLRSLASDEARTGELVLSLLHPGRLGTVFQPSFVDRLRADLESAPEARAALRAGSATPGADRTPPAELVELLLDWEELELFVDLSGALRSHREALHARAYDQVEWMGGVSLLGQLALTPLPVEVMRCDGARARLFPTTPPGLSKELAATLESLVLDLSSPLVFAAGDSRLCREGLGGAGIHRVLVREAGSAPVGGTQLFSVAGLLCFQYPDRPAVAPSRVSQSGGGPTLRVLAPPDLRSRRGSHIRTLLQADPVVEVEVGTSGEARCRPLDRVPGDAVVRTESPGWSSFLRVTLSPANTLALRSGRSSLHIEGPAGDANVTVRVAMEPCVQVAGRGYPAVFLARLDRLPGGFKPQSPLMRRLADAAHATAPEHGLVVRVSVGGGAPEAVAVQGVVRTAWREAGVLRGESVSSAQVEVRDAAAPLAAAVSPGGGGLRLEHLVRGERPLLGSGVLSGPQRLVAGACAPGAPLSTTRSSEGWGGRVGVRDLLDTYLAWETAVSDASQGTDPALLSLQQAEVCRWLDLQLAQALCGQRWVTREREAVAALRERASLRMARSLVRFLLEEDDVAAVTLDTAGWDARKLAEALEPPFARLGAPPWSEAAAAELSTDVTSALDRSLRDAGLFRDGELEADVWLDLEALERLWQASTPTRALERLAALVRPPRIRSVLAQSRSWSWMTPARALFLTDGAYVGGPPGGHLRSLLLAWSDPDTIALDTAEHRDAMLESALKHRDAARAVRWMALALRGDLDGHR